MNFDLLINNINDYFSVFKCENDIKSWLNKNNLSLNFLTKNDILNQGNRYIQDELNKRIKEIETELVFDSLNAKIEFQQSANFETKEILGASAVGLGVATLLTAFFSVAFLPAALFSGAATFVLGNFSARQKTFDALLKNSDEAAKNIAKQMLPIIKEHLDKTHAKNAFNKDQSLNASAPSLPLPSETKEKSTLSKEQIAIKDFLEKRGIKYLIHFTNSKNIESIKKHGILSVQELNKRNLPFYKNDENRFDNKLDYISLSVTHPNDYVLNNFKETGRIDNVSLIYIDASILYKEISTHRIYCDRNAAKSSCEKGSTLYYFENMFGHNKSYDRTYKTPNEPTDKQAEILFNKRIDSKYIISIQGE